MVLCFLQLNVYQQKKYVRAKSELKKHKNQNPEYAIINTKLEQQTETDLRRMSGEVEIERLSRQHRGSFSSLKKIL